MLTADRVRSLFAWQQEGGNFSFAEDLVLEVHPAKEENGWLYGTVLSTGKSGLVPASYVASLVECSTLISCLIQTRHSKEK